jgi:hypothetical protein
MVRIIFCSENLKTVLECVTEQKLKAFYLILLIVTFKDLQKLVQSQLDPEQSQLLQRLRGKPFYVWDPKQHKQEDIKTKGDCCFNHVIGLQEKLE